MEHIQQSEQAGRDVSQRIDEEMAAIISSLNLARDEAGRFS